jgi:pimeloyl-ACP methyl ester carboxylesterase
MTASPVRSGSDWSPATDRGSGSPRPTRTPPSAAFADDTIALADHLGIDRWRPFAWSAGAPFALGPGRAPSRARRSDRGVAAGLVPFEAYETPRASSTRPTTDATSSPSWVQSSAPRRWPRWRPRCWHRSPATTRWHESTCSRGPTLPARAVLRRHALAASRHWPLGWSMRSAKDSTGLTRELELQVEDPDVDWSLVAAPVDLWYGSADTTAPPTFGEWWADRLARRRPPRVPRRGPPRDVGPMAPDPRGPGSLTEPVRATTAMASAIVEVWVMRELPLLHAGSGGQGLSAAGDPQLGGT